MMPLPPSIELLLRQGQRNVGRINARSSAIGSALQPYSSNVSAMYGGLQSNEQAIGGAVANSQTQLGQQLGGSISSALQGIQAPNAAVAGYGGGTATTGAQAGQAIGGLSAAELGRLRGEGSAEAIYAAALPRLAALAGDAERRGYLSELANEMSDLALQESQRMSEQRLEQQRYDQEWRYKVQQDRIDQKNRNRAFRYQRNQARLARKRQAKQDKFAHDLAVSNNLLDYQQEARYRGQAAETARHHGATEGASARSAAETARHHRETEAAARAREARQRNKKTGGGVDYKDIVASAKDMGKPGENPRTGQVISHTVSRQEARRRLRAEFPGASPQTIDRALRAAGY